MSDVRLIDANAAEEVLLHAARCCIGDDPLHSLVRDAYDDAVRRIRDVPDADPVQWHNGLPPEHETVFARLKGTDKWLPSMFEKMLRNVLVTLEMCDKNGTPERIVTVAHTVDGQWRGLPFIVPNKVIAWADMPAPLKGWPE